MGYSDYLAGLRDGFAIGFNAGYRKGWDDGVSSAYLAGYNDGYRDGSLGLPYSPRERLLGYRDTLPDPLPLPDVDLFEKHRYDPILPLPRNDYLTPEIDLKPKYEPLPKYELLLPPRIDFGPDPIDPFPPYRRRKEPWEL